MNNLDLNELHSDVHHLRDLIDILTDLTIGAGDDERRRAESLLWVIRDEAGRVTEKFDNLWGARAS